MSKDCIVVLIRPESMRLFYKEQSHDAFVDIEYKGQSIIELSFDVSGDDVLIGDERNPNNYSSYINPISSITKKEYNKAGVNQSNVELLIDAVQKILLEHHTKAKKSAIFSTSIARSLLCVVFDLGIDTNSIELVQQRFKTEPFAGVVFHSTIDEYFESIPKTSKPKILINSVGSDLYYFYQHSTKIKQRKLESVAFNPLIEVVAKEIFQYIDRTNSHLTFDYLKEKQRFLFEAQKIVEKNQPINLGEVQLTNGRTFEFQIYLAQSKSKAEKASETALIIREIISITAEAGIDDKDLCLYYSGKNISNDYFDSLFANNVTEVHHIEDYNALQLQLKHAKEKLDDFSFQSSGKTLERQEIVKTQQQSSKKTIKVTETNSEQLSNSSSTPTPTKPPVVENTSLTSPPPPPKQVENKTSKAPLPPPPIGKTKTTTTTKKKAPPPPPPPPPAPPKGPTSAKKKVAAPGKKKAPPPPPPAPPKGPTSAKKKVAASGKNKMAPPPPPPPKRK